MQRGQALYTALEHEAMHQETLLYMWHRLPYDQKRKPDGVRYQVEQTTLPASNARGPDTRRDRDTRRQPAPRRGSAGTTSSTSTGCTCRHSRSIHNVTNADFLEFVEAGGYDDATLWSAEDWAWLQADGVTHPAFWVEEHGQWFWRGMFEVMPLPLSWPVYVSQAEASAYARWKGRRLPTEAEFHRAAFGTPGGTSGVYPWGEAPPDATRGNFDFSRGSRSRSDRVPAGASAWGVHDLVGNGWEWTSTVFGPFPGFDPMASYPEYSADFFDGQHYVMKGASPATARELVRRSFRNWFRPNYPYVYATFRTAA